MPPIRYINLDRDTERRLRMEAELARLQLHGERFPAVLWSSLDRSEQARLYDPQLNACQHHLPLVNGEKGCYASHIGLWRWLIESSHECLVVLEDDIRLLDDFPAICERIAVLEREWDMVKLIGREGLGKTEKLVAQWPLRGDTQLVQYRRVPSLTAGYVIHRQGARKLIARRTPFGRPIDVDLRHWWECQNFCILGIRPAAIALAETSAQSSIQADLKRLALRQRWQKFVHRTRYSIANAWHASRSET